MFVLMLRWMERGKDAAAGVTLAFATLLRAFPMLLVGYLILMKRWRVIAYTMVGLAVGGLLTLALAGFGSTLSFLLAPTYLTEQWRELLPGNIALEPTVSRMFWYFFGIHLGATLDWTRKIVSWGAELGLLALTVKATVTRPSHDDPDGRLFILWIMTAVLVSPTSWFYYLVLLAIPMVRLSAAAADGRTSRRALWAGVACYTLAWLYFTGVDLRSQQLALHPNALVWRVGASPIGLLAYLSLYWFATDASAGDKRLAQSAASSPAAPINEARPSRTAV
jgi:Glycosyltransferase family 87